MIFWLIVVPIVGCVLLALCETGASKPPPPLPPDWEEKHKLAERVRRAERGEDPWGGERS
jgi:hypothetical protein